MRIFYNNKSIISKTYADFFSADSMTHKGIKAMPNAGFSQVNQRKK